MPKGVEHESLRDAWWVARRVPASVMPKGVEHLRNRVMEVAGIRREDLPSIAEEPESG